MLNFFKRKPNEYRIPFSAAGTKLTVIKELPRTRFDCEKTSFSCKNLDLTFKYFWRDENDRLLSNTIEFEFIIGFSTVSETNKNASLPPDSNTIYKFATNVREDFSGFQLWLADNQVITVVCKNMKHDGEVY